MQQPAEYEMDMYTGQPEYYDALEDQQAFFEPEVNQWSAPSEAPVAGQVDEFNHLQMEDLRAVQSAVFCVNINSSLSDWAKNRNNGTWTMNPQLLQYLQEVVTNKNRANAGTDERAGNMERVIPLAATIIEVHNEHSIPIGVNIPGFVPKTFTDNGRYLWVLEPHTPPTQVEYKVTEPDNFLTKQMYSDWRACDEEQLAREIRMDPEENVAVMRTDGLAFKLLMESIMEGRFDDDQEMQELKETAARNRRVEVPLEVGQQVHNWIATPLRDIRSRFLNMKDFRAHFNRADGRPVDSAHGLVGAPMGVSTGYVDTDKRYTPKRAGFKIRLDYITMD